MEQSDAVPAQFDRRFLSRNGEVEHRSWLEKYYRAAIKEKGAEAAMEIADTIASLHRERVRDSLTGLYTLAYVESMVQQQVALMHNVGSALAVLMIDLDHFRDVNTKFGHSAGNRALMAMAEMLRDGVGPEGVVGRYGGEEFIALVPYAEEGRMEQVGLIIGNTVFTNLAKMADLPERLTLSVGAVIAVMGESTNKIVERADSLLYQAKEGGRARLVYKEVDGSLKVVKFG